MFGTQLAYAHRLGMQPVLRFADDKLAMWAQPLPVAGAQRGARSCSRHTPPARPS